MARVLPGALAVLLVFFHANISRSDEEFLKKELPEYQRKVAAKAEKYLRGFKKADKLWDEDKDRKAFQAEMPPSPLIYAGLNYAMTQDELTKHLKDLFEQYRREGKLFSREEWLKCVHPTVESVQSPARPDAKPMGVYASNDGKTKWIEKRGSQSIYRFLASEWINSWHDPKLKSPRKIMVVEHLSNIEITVNTGSIAEIESPWVNTANVVIFAEKIEGGHFTNFFSPEWDQKIIYKDKPHINNPSDNVIEKNGAQYIIDLEYKAIKSRTPDELDPLLNYAELRTDLVFPIELSFDFSHINAPPGCGL